MPCFTPTASTSPLRPLKISPTRMWSITAQWRVDPPCSSSRHRSSWLTKCVLIRVGPSLSLEMNCCVFPFLFFSQNSNNSVYRRIYQHMERKKSFVSSMEEGVRRTQEGNFAFIGEAVSLDLAVAHHCKLARSQEVIAMRAYAIAARLGESSSPVRMSPPVVDMWCTLKPPSIKAFTAEGGSWN